jgi:hypothetical protein
MADQRFQIQGMPGQQGQARFSPQQGVPQQGYVAQPQPGADGMMMRRMVPREGMDNYYSNCAVVASSPREISVLFGRYVTPPPGAGPADLTPVYEKQIYMTVEQAEDLAKALIETVKAFNAQKAEGS